jgi:hypothetical protein
MSKLREVTIYKLDRVVSPTGQIQYEKVVDGHGLFHAWGMDYKEFETGPGSYSTAIIEMPDGSIRNVAVEMIKFDK